mgnify:FL=1
MSSTIALRERKKNATKAALSNAALDLADRHGLAQLRIEDIAEQAGVSLRTFRNYFANKEAAVVGLLTHNYDLVIDGLRKRPSDEEIWVALAHACKALYPTDPDRSWVRRMRLLRAEPALTAEKYRAEAMILDTLAEEIARRNDGRTGAAVYPRLVAEITQAALRAAIDYWLDAPNAAPLREVVWGFISKIRIE